MIMEDNVAKSYSEVDVILSKLDKKYYDKISKEFLNFISTNEDKKYKIYFCDKEQRTEYDNMLNNNQFKFEQEQKDQYDVKKMFQQRRINSNIFEEPVQEKLQMIVVKKENIFIRFFHYLFKRKHGN